LQPLLDIVIYAMKLTGAIGAQVVQLSNLFSLTFLANQCVGIFLIIFASILIC